MSWIELIVDCNERTCVARAGGDDFVEGKGRISWEYMDNDHETCKVYKIPRWIETVVPAMSSRSGNTVEIELIDA